MVINFICDRYGGIRQKHAQFTEKVISCSDCQNVELFYTGINSGVGIRTVKGHKGIKELAENERIVNLFPSVQNGSNYIFVHAINNETGTLYLYDIATNELIPKITDLTRQTVSSGCDYKQGYDDCFIFSNKGDYLQKIQLNKQVTAYQVKYEDTIGYVEKNRGDLITNENVGGIITEQGILTFGGINFYNISVSDSFIVCVLIGEDIITKKEITTDFFGVGYIENGNFYSFKNELLTQVSTNSKIYIKFSFKKEENSYIELIQYSKNGNDFSEVYNEIQIDKLQFNFYSDNFDIDIINSFYNNIPLAKFKPENPEAGDIIYSDTNLTIEYKTIKTVYQVKYEDSIGYVDIQGNQGDYLAENTIVYSDTELSQILAEATGYDFTYTDVTDIDYKFEYTGYVDKEVSELNFKDAENRDIKPNFICNYDNRIFGAINNRLHSCMQQNIFDWATGDVEKPTSAYYIEFAKEITAITPYLNSSLAVFFKDSSLLVKGSYPELQLTEESPGGCASYKSLVFHGTDLYFYDNTKKGIYSFQQVVLGNKTLGKDISIEVNNLLDLIDESRIEDVKFTSYVADDRNEIWFLLPTTDEKYSTILIYDSLRDEWVKRKSNKIYSVEVLHNVLFSGGRKIYQEYINDDFDGEFIQNYYNCSPFNLGSNTSMKILYLRPRMSVTFPYINEFWVKYEKNFNPFKKPKKKKVKSKFKNYMIWGQGKWGVNYWAGGTTNSVLKLPNVSAFKTIGISFYTENSKQNFAIRNMEMNQVDSIQT